MSDEQLILWVKPGVELPCRQSPLRFAVRMERGLTSNAWGVSVEETGDAYIYCRDNMKEQKVSLHRSGKQQIAFNKPLLSAPMESRFMNQWREPEGSPVVPTFTLFFPRWGVGLNAEQRDTYKSIWNKNDILIRGDEASLTVVSFFILDAALPFPEMPSRVPIGVFSLRPGKTLWVIAGREPEGDLKARVKADLAALAALAPSKKVDDLQFLETPVVCLMGYLSENSQYMMVVPVTYTPPPAASCASNSLPAGRAGRLRLRHGAFLPGGRPV